MVRKPTVQYCIITNGSIQSIRALRSGNLMALMLLTYLQLEGHDKFPSTTRKNIKYLHKKSSHHFG